MGLLDRLFGPQEMHIYLYVDGALRVDKDELHEALEGISTTKKMKLKKFRKDSPQFEPQLGEVQIPIVDFGEQVDDE